MNVLSLFDGMSCGRIALERAGIPVTNYYASEIDKYAIKVSQANYSDIKRLGCVTKHDNWELPEIDLLIAGFPCQAWSMAGKQKGDIDPRGALVHDLIEIWEKYKPKYFMFENVKMKKEFIGYISGLFGVEPIEINSALVSAQNRSRLYWTNIPVTEHMDDKGIVLGDVFTGGENITKRVLAKPEGRETHIKCWKNMRTLKQKSKCLTASGQNISNSGATNVDMENGEYRKLLPIDAERLQTVPDGYTNHVSDTQRHKMIGNGWTVDVIAHIFKGLK